MITLCRCANISAGPHLQEHLRHSSKHVHWCCCWLYAFLPVLLQVTLPARGSTTGVNDGAYEFQFNRA
jgi:hypothetical protein